MVPTTDVLHPGDAAIAAFYDALAADYDLMTEFDKRFVVERPFFHHLVERYGVKTAIDAGCGTGFHSLLLAQLGVDVTAVDVSHRMLAALRRHAEAMKLQIRTVEASFQDLASHLQGPFDAVFSMGNSLAHILSREEFAAVLRAFRSLLRPGGILFFQNLNYDRIMAERKQIQIVKDVGGVTFLRYYEYGDATLTFHVVKSGWTDRRESGPGPTVELRPLYKGEVVQSLEEAGFASVSTYGGISLGKFDPRTSKDLVVLAKAAG